MNTVDPRLIDHIFAGMLNVYGTDFTRRYPGSDVNKVLATMKSEWAHQLSRLGNEAGLARIAWAMENLPDDAPNSVQFRNLCWRAPVEVLPEEAPKEEHYEVDPAKVRQAREHLKKLQPLSQIKEGHSLDWARRIKAQLMSPPHNITRCQAEMANDALRRYGS